MSKKSKWNWLFVILAALILFSVIAVPKIAINAINQSKGQIISVMPE